MHCKYETKAAEEAVVVREALRGSEPGHAHNVTAHHLLLTTYYSLLTAHY